MAIRAVRGESGPPWAVWPRAGWELRSDHGPQYTGEDCGALCTRWGWSTPSRRWVVRPETPSLRR
jgi:hypothetical protein